MKIIGASCVITGSKVAPQAGASAPRRRPPTCSLPWRRARVATQKATMPRCSLLNFRRTKREEGDPPPRARCRGGLQSGAHRPPRRRVLRAGSRSVGGAAPLSPPPRRRVAFASHPCLRRLTPPQTKAREHRPLPPSAASLPRASPAARRAAARERASSACESDITRAHGECADGKKK